MKHATTGGTLRVVRSLALLAGLAFPVPLTAQAPTEAQVKAAFVYNFLKFVDWPASSLGKPDDPFVVAIVGDGATADAVEAFLTDKQVGDRRVLTKRLRWDQSVAGAQAVFVSDGDARKVRSVAEAAVGASALSIGESEGFATNGGMIALLIEARRVRFDIDTDAAASANLRISSKLLALGRIIHAGKSGDP